MLRCSESNVHFGLRVGRLRPREATAQAREAAARPGKHREAEGGASKPENSTEYDPEAESVRKIGPRADETMTDELRGEDGGPSGRTVERAHTTGR